MLDWSYNYHASNMYQQVAPIYIYVKKKEDPPPPPPYLQSTNNHLYICVCIHTDN